MRADSASASADAGLADQQGGLAAVQVAEDERHVEAVAGAEDAAHARRGPGQLVDMGTAAGGGVRLGEVQGRHPEQPVGVDQFIQLLRAGGREGLAVAAGAVRAGGEDAQGGLGLFLGHLAEHAVDAR